jgi:hypothetical protein
MQLSEFDAFRLVGGTSLSLQWGHRMSDDIDLFTDAGYGSIDFAKIDKALRNSFPYVSDQVNAPIGNGVSYLLGKNSNNAVKLDLYHTEPFIRKPISIGSYRLAMVDEILAMKIDIVERKARKKDFWDIHELIETYKLDHMIALHKERYPYTHDEEQIKKNFTDFSKADQDFNPTCLRGKHWELIKLDIVAFVDNA